MHGLKSTNSAVMETTSDSRPPRVVSMFVWRRTKMKFASASHVFQLVIDGKGVVMNATHV